ncbi:LysR substrate-binding domain-containing protein [Stenoxybacter acetivorans]|uniref:LysR substrate-binding domain-containing protein n=1 Tax=Stenoxybacter acetivorans TaxID=422441 RepID=UPI000567568E|nr:LysR substrate-binding domain-containing protein [Stenoxybacter acetivorans]
MKLQQLRYALAVYRQNLNVSDAADVLFTSQPGVSKQIRLLEEELGVPIFVRHGKRIASVTEPGKILLDTAAQILRNVDRMKHISAEFADQTAGKLTIAALPAIASIGLIQTITEFLNQYQSVELIVLTANESVLNQMVLDSEVDFAIGMKPTSAYPELCRLRCPNLDYEYRLIAPLDSTCPNPPSLKDISQYSLIADSFAFCDGSPIKQAFEQAHLPLPRTALTSDDSNMIKNCVKQGFGLGLLPAAALFNNDEKELMYLDTKHLFASAFPHVILRKDNYLRGFVYAFLLLLDSSFTRERIDEALYTAVVEDFSI